MTTRICILVSSYEGTNGQYSEIPDIYQDPSIYVNHPSYEFTTKFITKANAKIQIDQAVEENYDYYWNFLWGTEKDNVAGIKAIQHLESKQNVQILGASAKYVSLTKLDLKFLGQNIKNLRLPKWTLGSTMEKNLESLEFPLIIKAIDGLCSLHMTPNSVCKSKEELMNEVKNLKEKIGKSTEILIEEFIIGQEVSCMVFETKDGLIALNPIQYEFPKGRPELECFLDWDSKNGSPMKYKILKKNDPNFYEIQRQAILGFQALEVRGSGYARVDLRVSGKDVYLIEVNNTPAFFSPKGNEYGDDDVIEQTFPGGHLALVQMIISSKENLLKS